MPGAMLAPLTAGRFFASWTFDPGWTVVAALLVVGYAAGLAGARRRQAAWPWPRTLAWGLGVALLVLATQGGIAVYGDALFWLHMWGHLTMIMVVPLALLWGRPLDLALAATGSTRLERVLRGRAVAVATHPFVGLAAYTVAIVGTHLTGFMDAMMTHPWLHGVESGGYLFAGLLFFAPLVADPPIRWRLSPPMRMMMLVVAMPVDTFTGVILGQTRTYPWPMMAQAHPPWALGLINDLHAGGAVMWVGGDSVMAVVMGIAAIRWARLASAGAIPELGGWLAAARVNYQRSVYAGAAGEAADPAEADAAGRTGDSDRDLADYNAYLARLNARDTARGTTRRPTTGRTG